MSMTAKFIRCSVLSVFTAVLMSGCAGIHTRAEAPSISLSNLEILKVGLLEQRYRLKLRIQNPNDFALPISGMKYQLDINDQKFANGVSRQAVTIPAFGEGMMDVEVFSNFGRIMEQFSGLASGRMQKVSYRLFGSVSMAHSVVKLPFEYKGDVGLNFSTPGANP